DILARVAYGLELVAVRAEGAARGERHVGPAAEPRALKHLLIRVGRLFIEREVLRLIARERIEVLHDELARAHEARLGARLVAEFCLELIRIARQIAPGGYLLAHEVGERL